MAKRVADQGASRVGPVGRIRDADRDAPARDAPAPASLPWRPALGNHLFQRLIQAGPVPPEMAIGLRATIGNQAVQRKLAESAANAPPAEETEHAGGSASTWRAQAPGATGRLVQRHDPLLDEVEPVQLQRMGAGSASIQRRTQGEAEGEAQSSMTRIAAVVTGGLTSGNRTARHTAKAYHRGRIPYRPFTRRSDRDALVRQNNDDPRTTAYFFYGLAQDNQQKSHPLTGGVSDRTTVSV